MRTPESYEKKDVDKYLASIGAYVVKPAAFGYGKSGNADRVVCIAGTFWSIEVKRQGKGPTVLQQERMDEVKAAGGMAIAGTAEVVITAIEQWRKHRPTFSPKTYHSVANFIEKVYPAAAKWLHQAASDLEIGGWRDSGE